MEFIKKNFQPIIFLVAAIWAVEAALLLGIALVLATSFGTLRGKLAEGSRTAVGGSLLAAMNTAYWVLVIGVRVMKKAPV